MPIVTAHAGTVVSTVGSWANQSWMLGAPGGGKAGAGSTANRINARVGAFFMSAVPADATITRVTVTAHGLECSRPHSFNAYNSSGAVVGGWAYSSSSNSTRTNTIASPMSRTDISSMALEVNKADERFTTGISTGLSVDAFTIEIEYEVVVEESRAQRWNGTEWIAAEAKRWTGSEWVAASIHRVGE